MLLASLSSPYVRLLQHWVCEGSLVDPAGEMPLRSATFAQPGEEGWGSAFALRTEAEVPPPLRPLAAQLLLGGWSRHLLARLPPPPPPTSAPLPPPPASAPPSRRTLTQLRSSLDDVSSSRPAASGPRRAAVVRAALRVAVEVRAGGGLEEAMAREEVTP